MSWQKIKQRPWLSNGLLLAAFALVTTLLIGLTHSGTRDAIQRQQQQQLLDQLNQVIPKALHDNDLAATCAQIGELTLYRAKKADSNTAIAVKTRSNEGYNGKIALLIGIRADGTLLGVRTLSHKETPGLGDKIDLRISDWILSFTGKTLSEKNHKSWAVHKDGGQFDQFTGATITPRAVVKAVKHTLEEFASQQQRWFNQTNTCGGDDT